MGPERATVSPVVSRETRGCDAETRANTCSPMPEIPDVGYVQPGGYRESGYLGAPALPLPRMPAQAQSGRLYGYKPDPNIELLVASGPRPKHAHSFRERQMIALAFLRESYFGGLFHVKQHYSSRESSQVWTRRELIPAHYVALRLLCPSLKAPSPITTRTVLAASASRRRPGATEGAI